MRQTAAGQSTWLYEQMDGLHRGWEGKYGFCFNFGQTVPLKTKKHESMHVLKHYWFMLCFGCFASWWLLSGGQSSHTTSLSQYTQAAIYSCSSLIHQFTTEGVTSFFFLTKGGGGISAFTPSTHTCPSFKLWIICCCLSEEPWKRRAARQTLSSWDKSAVDVMWRWNTAQREPFPRWTHTVAELFHPSEAYRCYTECRLICTALLNGSSQ